MKRKANFKKKKCPPLLTRKGEFLARKSSGEKENLFQRRRYYNHRKRGSSFAGLSGYFARIRKGRDSED